MFSLHAFCRWMHVVREDGRNALFSGVPGTSHVIWYTCMYLIYFRENMSCCFFSRQRTRDGETEEFSSLRRTSTKGSWKMGEKGVRLFFLLLFGFSEYIFLRAIYFLATRAECKSLCQRLCFFVWDDLTTTTTTTERNFTLLSRYIAGRGGLVCSTVCVRSFFPFAGCGYILLYEVVLFFSLSFVSFLFIPNHSFDIPKLPYYTTHL